jgi:C-terminal processing protease CtpA/Prc
MTILRTNRSVLAVAVLVASFAAQAAQGRLGFSVAVETDGLFSRTLKHITIKSIVPGAPAEQAGLRAGDEVEAINDVVVAGANGSSVMDIVKGTQPGQHLRLKVLRGGAEQVVDITAGLSD